MRFLFVIAFRTLVLQREIEQLGEIDGFAARRAKESAGVNILHSWGELFPNVMRDSRHIFADFSLKLCVIRAILGRAIV